MVMIEIFHGLLFLATLLVQEVSRNVMQVYELNARLLGHLTIPFSIGVVAAFYLAVSPFVAWRQRYQDRRSALFSYVLNEFFRYQPNE